MKCVNFYRGLEDAPGVELSIHDSETGQSERIALSDRKALDLLDQLAGLVRGRMGALLDEIQDGIR